MRVVRPDHDLGARPLPAEMSSQRIQPLGHVGVAQVPRLAAMEHDAVVGLGVLNQPCVLLSEEKLVLGHAPVALHELGGSALKIQELANSRVCARLSRAKASRIAIILWISAKLLEASVALAGLLRRLRINSIQVAKHCLDRAVEAVKVEPIKAGLGRIAGKRIVMIAQPADEIEHI